MTREEALKVANEMRQWLRTDREKEALETLIPELQEPEDERITKTLQEYVKNRNWPLNGPTQDEALAWLDKQKEQKHYWKPTETDVALFNKAVTTNKALTPTERAQLDIIRSKFCRCGAVNCCGIVQKEQKPSISIDQLKSMMLQYLQEAANEKDDSDIEADTDKWARKILGYDFEQKPVERDEEDETGERNPEWSEEDEKMVYQVLCYLDPTITRAKREEIELWLKSLLERFNLQPKQERDEEDERVRKWLLEYFYLHRDDLRGASVTSMEILSFLDRHPGKGKACDVDDFSLTLRNCLSADSELTDEQADTFARAYGEDLYKVALGEMKSGADRYDIEEYRNKVKFNPKPGEKFWVRCKTDKAENLWFNKGDERPAYAVTDANGFITYIVHIKKDGTGNCVSYQNKDKFLNTFDILESKQ